ncbi:MAG: DUF547 domain-containing protein [Epsilonproteobacteria bacterium]|nr:MAG: DUF547 domain-containing protein [Campylobacterota bacterium]RLA67253.1 MAG: DUF547 domain-containing protein [Campylobacterota bacterium]
MKYLLLFLISFNTWAFDLTHKSYNDLLKKVVSRRGNQTLVDYKGLKKDPVVFNKYLGELSRVKRSEFSSWNKNDQLAFLINAYNAFTLKLIIDNYPVKSIKKIGSFFSSPWKKKFFKLFAEKMSLDQIEHGMIRANYKEPRIHFAVNCASIGCPNLGPFAFTGPKLDQQLNESSRLFVQDSEKNHFKNNTLYASKIFKWYGGDFKEKFGSYKGFIAGLITEDKKTQELIKSGKIKTQYLDYDWNLNEK